MSDMHLILNKHMLIKPVNKRGTQLNGCFRHISWKEGSEGMDDRKIEMKEKKDSIALVSQG